MIRPCNDWVLVRIHPLPKYQGELHLVGDVTNLRTGVVIRTGPGKFRGKHRVPVGVYEGDQVAFLRWNQEHLQGKQVTNYLKEVGEDLALIQAGDILLAWSSWDKHVVL